MAATTRFCQRCKVEIPTERIEIIPETRLCVKCSEAVGGEFEVMVIPDNLGKSGSLKKNYGSWTVQKRRRRIEPAEE
jgi:DksA/TraR C4-type zinc finger protein